MLKSSKIICTLIPSHFHSATKFLELIFVKSFSSIGFASIIGLKVFFRSISGIGPKLLNHLNKVSYGVSIPCHIFSISSSFLSPNLANAVLASLDETPIRKPPLINLIKAHLSVSFAIDRKVCIFLLNSSFLIFFKILIIFEI